VMYIPLEAGPHELDVGVDAEPVKDSAFTVIVTGLVITAAGPGLSEAIVGEPAAFGISVTDPDGQPTALPDGGEGLKVVLTDAEAPEDHPSVDGSVGEGKKEGMYDGLYTATRSGTHLLLITYNGLHIKDSPFELNVTTARLCPRDRLLFNGSCHPCPLGGLCDGSTAVRADYDFWQEMPANADTLPRFQNCAVSCHHSRVQCCVSRLGCRLNQSRCAVGRVGRMCGDCEAGKCNVRGVCMKCNDTYQLPALLVILAISIGLLIYLASDLESKPLVWNLVSFFQALCYVQGGSSTFVRFLAVVDPSAIDALPVLPFTQYTQIKLAFLASSLPLALSLFLLIKCPQQTHSSPLTFGILLAFPGLTRCGVQLLNCRTVQLEHVLTAAPHVSCWQGDHILWAVLAIGSCCLISVGIPAALLLGGKLQDMHQMYPDKGWMASVSLLLRAVVVTVYVLHDCHRCCHQLATSLSRYVYTIDFVIVVYFQPYKRKREVAHHLLTTAALYVITTLFWEEKCFERVGEAMQIVMVLMVVLATVLYKIF